MARTELDINSLQDIVLTAAHLPKALRLSIEAHWNQLEADWRMLLDLGQVLGLVDTEDRLVATAGVLPFEGSCAWINMVLVTAAWQRRGLATRLMERAIDLIEAKNCTPMLDATPAGRAVYQGLGFVDGWAFSRWMCKTPAALPTPTLPDRMRLRHLETHDWEQISRLDRTALGAARPQLLHALAERLPQAAWVAENQGELAGFLLGRTGRNATQLGPLVAADESCAKALLAAGLRSVAGPVCVDAVEGHTATHELLRQAGFTIERPFIRMARPGVSRTVNFGNPALYFAVAGPELG